MEPALLLTAAQHKLNRSIWWAIALLAGVDTVWAWRADMAIHIPGLLISSLVVLVFVAIIYGYIRPDKHLFLFSQVIMQLVTGTAALGIFSYVTARMNYDLVDAQLIAVDHFLHFDWRAWAQWWNDWPQLSSLLAFAYFSCLPQVAVIVLCLFATQQAGHIQRFIFAYIYSAALVVFLAMLFPAVGAYVYYHLDAHQWAGLNPVAARVHEVHLTALRAHTLQSLSLPESQGIVTFPSFHTVLAILLMYASVPVRWLRVVIIPLNILVIISTPVNGGHYLVDVVAGGLIAINALWLTEKYFGDASLPAKAQR